MYVLLVGTFPFNSVLAGMLSSLGFLTLTGALPINTSARIPRGCCLLVTSGLTADGTLHDGPVAAEASMHSGRLGGRALESPSCIRHVLHPCLCLVALLRSCQLTSHLGARVVQGDRAAYSRMAVSTLLPPSLTWVLRSPSS